MYMGAAAFAYKMHVFYFVLHSAILGLGVTTPSHIVNPWLCQPN